MKRRGELPDLIDTGLSLISEERALFQTGQFDHLADISAQKQNFIEDLEALAPRVVASPDDRDALRKLIAESQRNERLIDAARTGVKAARRKVEAILSTRKGAVAYDETGKEILSRADAMGRTKQA